MPVTDGCHALKGRATDSPTRRLANSPPNRHAVVFVWSVWGLMLAADFLFIDRYAVNLPFGDSWELVPAITGQQPITPEWLWQQHNEHRLPLPKLLLVAVGRLSGGDFRVGAYLNAVGLAVAAGMLIVGVRRSRGYTRYADAFFPLVLLHVGNHDTLLFDFVVNFVATTVLAVLMLRVMLSAGSALSLKGAVLGGVYGSALVACGATGLVLASAFSAWMALVGWWQLHDGSGSVRRAGGFAMLAAGVVLGAIGGYFVGYRSTSFHPASAGFMPTLRIASQFLSVGVGPAGAIGWPGAHAWPLATPLLGAVWICCVAWLGGLAWRDKAERVCATGLAACFVGIAMLAGAIGWGRSGIDDPTIGYSNRYITLAALFPVLVYLTGELASWRVGELASWNSYSPTRSLAHSLRWLPLAMLLGMGTLVVFNTRHGCRAARADRAMPDAVTRELRAGASPDELAARYGWVLYSKATESELARKFEMLRDARMGPYK